VTKTNLQKKVKKADYSILRLKKKSSNNFSNSGSKPKSVPKFMKIKKKN